MSRIIALPSLKSKPTRRTARPDAPFGAGILPYRPSSGRMPYTAEDLAWAAQAFADPEPDWDQLAGEAAFLDTLEALTPAPVDRCRSCGELSEALAGGRCPECRAFARFEAPSGPVEPCRTIEEWRALGWNA